MVHSTVKADKQDKDGNPIGSLSDNPILDTCLYDIEFLDGEVTLLTANAVARAIYEQFNIDRNKNLPFECLVDVQKDPMELKPRKKLSITAESTYNILP